ncbi:MAG: hypothetical protein ACXU8A_04995 [Burkholderiaceae bacterium]
MTSTSHTQGESWITLKRETAVEQQLQCVIDNTSKAPPGECRVVSPELLVAAKKEIRRLRARLIDNGIEDE